MLPKSAYEQWLENEGVPIHTGYHVPDISAIPRGDWPRLGSKAAVFHLRGMDGFTLSYVVEVAPGEALRPQRHMYEELLYAWQGSGVMTLFGRDGTEAVDVPWQKGTLMAPPLNCRYQIRNTSDELALVVGVTNIPMVMDMFYNEDFVFGSDAWFGDRMDALRSALDDGPRTYLSERGNNIMEAAKFDNVDMLADEADLRRSTTSQAMHGVFSIAGNTLAGHLAQEPVGRYDPSHYHGGGANILVLRSHGYSLLWPPECGPRPYEAGHGDQVVRVDWGPGSIVSPPGAWFHQHFNLGDVPARNIACRFGYGLVRPTRFYIGTHDVNGRTACTVSYKLGGTLVPLEDEDPQIRADYEAGRKAEGQRA
jgi:hypothetical protein